jgi:hypothetical protein
MEDDMREILFKGIDAITGKWMQSTGITYTKCDMVTPCLYDGSSWREVLRDSVCQYVGIRDSNAVRIFNKDKVDLLFTPYEGCGGPDVEYKGYITIEPWGLYFNTDDKDQEGNNGSNFLLSYYNFSDESITVTGNIHDKEAPK